MLVLTRRTDQRIVIGDTGLRVTVIEIHGDKVRLGFEGDDGVRIFREELLTRDHRRKEAGSAA